MMKQDISNSSCHACKDGKYINTLSTASEVLNKDKPVGSLVRGDYWDLNLIPDYWYINEISEFVEKLEEFEDIYICNNPACNHIYRNYYGNSADWHASDYRKNDHNNLDLGPKEEQDRRFSKVLTQIKILRPFFDKNDHVLEIATGKGYLARIMSKLGFASFTGSDIDPKVIEHNKIYNPAVNVILSDVIKLPEDKKYDIVIAMDVIEHVEDLKQIVKKMHSLTKKYAVVQVPVNRRLVPPNDPELQNGMDFDGHLHYFSKFSLNNLFTQDKMFKCVFMYKTARGEVANGPEILAVFEKV
jgi:2-polyprenyl-3-methyl-5-hydroxy-6-metoxy-1,4-benzoquinol methylase